MKFSVTAVSLLMPLAMAKNVIVSYPNSTPDSVVDGAKQLIEDQVRCLWFASCQNLFRRLSTDKGASSVIFRVAVSNMNTVRLKWSALFCQDVTDECGPVAAIIKFVPIPSATTTQWQRLTERPPEDSPPRYLTTTPWRVWGPRTQSMLQPLRMTRWFLSARKEGAQRTKLDRLFLDLVQHAYERCGSRRHGNGTFEWDRSNFR